MEAKELMIGDWVQFKSSDLSHQIKAIAGNSVKFDKGNWYSANTLNPVLLTKEILENNDFVYNQKNGAFVAYAYETYSNQMVEISLFYVVSVCNVQLLICESNNPDWKILRLMECNCVHKLQHALRLCGIEKEIIL